MENLSKIAQSIFLGNGEIWNFLDYTINRDIGGLLSYTKKNDFLGANLINNFNGGYTPKYKRSDINSTNSYALNRDSSDLSLAKQGRGGDIGETYKVPTTTNSELSFMYPQELEELWVLLREENTGRNRFPGEYGEKTVEKYINEINDGEEPSIQDIDLYGDIARNFAEKQNNIVKPNIGYKMSRDDKYLWEYKYYHPNPSHPFNYQHFNAKPNDRLLRLRPKGILDKAYEIYYGDGSEIKGTYGRPLDDYIYANDFIINNLKDTPWIINGSDRFEVKLDTTNVNIVKYLSQGLKTYSSSYKDEQLNSSLFWKPSNSYGVDYKNKGEEYYSIKEERKLKDKEPFIIPISPNFTNGEHTVYDPLDGVRDYTFYEEAGASKDIGTSDHVSDGSSVALSSYENGSTLLERTNKLFKESHINSLINRFHIKTQKDELTTAYNETFGLSRGRNLLKVDENGNVIIDKSSGYDDPYCRVWTARHQYSQLKDRIRPFVNSDGEPYSLSETQKNYGNLRPNNGLTRLNDYSVLGADGFVKITPTHNSGGLVEKEDHLKNYMFSIENLAWRDITANEKSTALSKEQIGPNNGRIMWFPPYNLRFSENVNVNWNSNSFIGRGEEIYTYTNTVRSGTLDFTLLIDHPSILNKWRGQIGNVEGVEKKKREEDLLRFFAGCGLLNDEVSSFKEEKESNKLNENRSVEVKPVTYTKDIAYVIFFPNDFSANDYMRGTITMDEGENKTKSKIKYACENILQGYNSGDNFAERDKSFQDEVLQSHNLISTGFSVSASIETIRETLFNGDENIEIKTIDELIGINSNFTGDKIYEHSSTTCKIQKVTVKGFASSHGYPKNNEMLRNRRRLFIQKAMEEYCQELSSTNVKYVFEEGSTVDVKDIDGREDINTLKAKLARAAYAIVSVEWKEENVAHEGNLITSGSGFTMNAYALDKPENKKQNNTKEVSTTTSLEYSEEEYTYDNEYLYFENVKNNKLVLKNIIDKVKYFDPAFHSITPEGFNARLTFLHQCTRQGPTNAVTSGRVKGVEKDANGNVISTGSDDYLKFAGNLSFGRAPYCILRIGDFFNTKICIDSMSINYDNNGVQWDLNPEGVGVQPMYANISISFKFLGGQDISRPIERLQNAVTANYYANASVYSRHADNNRHYYDAFEDKEKNKK